MVVQSLCDSEQRSINDHDEEAPASHAGSEHPQVGRGQPAARSRAGARRGVSASGDDTVDVAPVGRPVRRSSASDAKRLKELEAENAQLKKLLAEAELDKSVLREPAEGNV